MVLERENVEGQGWRALAVVVAEAEVVDEAWLVVVEGGLAWK